MSPRPDRPWSGVIAVIRAASAKDAEVAARGLAGSGVDSIEVTMTVPGATDVIRDIAADLGLPVGVGSVTDAAGVEAAVSAGATFVVSPGFVPEVVAAALEAAVPAIPGAMTPTEIMRAWESGASAVKVFPVTALGGPSYVRAVLAPLPHIPLIPSGGIEPEEVDLYLEAGAAAVSLGSSLIDRSAVAAGDADMVQRHARQRLTAMLSRQPEGHEE